MGLDDRGSSSYYNSYWRGHKCGYKIPWQWAATVASQIKHIHAKFNCTHVRKWVRHSYAYNMSLMIVTFCRTHAYTHTHSDCVVHVWPMVSFMDSCDNPYFISCRVIGSISPEVSTCQTVTSEASHGEWNCWCLPKRTHTSSSSSVSISISLSGIFFMTSISGLKSRQLWKKLKGKAQQCYYWICCRTGIEQHLTLCTHFASFEPFHPVSQSGTPSNSLWIKWYASLNQKP